MRRSIRSLLALGSVMAMAACSSSDPAPTVGNDADIAVQDRDPGPDGQDPGPLGIVVSVSGEELAIGGFPFPPTPGDEAVFVDGWELRFERILVTVGDVELHDDPDKVPSDQSQLGEAVARRAGPWVVDLHREGPLLGEGGGARERSQPITAFSGQNLRGNAPFAKDRRYAVSFRSVPATANAVRVHLDAAGEADFQDMVANGWTMLMVGEAQFRGVTCTSSDPTYDFGALPRHVRFRLGVAAPVQARNCQNERLAPAAPVSDKEEYPRGIQVNPGRSVVAQLTFHIEHIFKESFREGVPLRFDAFAARKLTAAAVGDAGSTSGAEVGTAEDAAPTSEAGPSGDAADYADAGTPNGAPLAEVPLVTERDLVGVAIDRVTDALGRRLPWRTCLGPDGSEAPSGPYVAYGTEGVPIDPSAPSSTALRDLADYTRYLVSWQGHLNGQGLCFTARDYPSP